MVPTATRVPATSARDSTGPARAEPTANAPSLRLAAVVKIWPRRDGGDQRWRVAKVAAKAGPSARPASATRARAAGNDEASPEVAGAGPARSEALGPERQSQGE